MSRRTPYQSQIEPLAEGHDPRHIEAWMRIEHGTLDHLTPHEFDAEVRMAILCIQHAEPGQSEDLARSYGF